MNTKANQNSLRKLKIGGISLISVAIVLVIVILANLAIEKLPSIYTKYSLSSAGLYDMTDNTMQIVKSVKDKINIYVVSEKGSLDEITYEYCQRISDLNSGITCSHVDPVLRPAFLSAYTEETLKSTETHVVVENATQKRSKVITYSEIYYQQYSDYEAYYYQMMGYQIDNPTYFDIENCLVNAIDYVTTDNLPTVYTTTGHGEGELDATVSKYVSDENITLSSLSLLTEGKVPADADMLIINKPSMDFSTEEVETLRQFIGEGGKILMTSGLGTNYVGEKLENLYGFAAELGLEFSETMVCEGSSNFYYQAPYYIIPQLADSTYSAFVPSNTYVVMPFSHGIVLNSEVEDVAVSALMTTSVKGYLATVENQSLVKDEEVGESKYIIGAESTKGDGKLLWFSSSFLLDGSTAGQFSNISYFIGVLTTVCGKTNSVTVNAKALQVEALTVPESSANLWGTIMIAIVPLLFIGIGILVWYRRSRR